MGVGDDGKRSVLARVSIVDVHGDAVMDTFVASKEKVKKMCLLISFRKSTPQQNRQLNIWISNSKQ